MNYSYNKNFLPKSYVLKRNRSETKGNKRANIILTFIVILLLPSTINNIFYKNKAENKKEQKNTVVAEEKSYDDEINQWLIVVGNMSEGEIKKDNVNITVNKETLQKIYNLQDIKVNTIDYLGDNRYKINVKKG